MKYFYFDKDTLILEQVSDKERNNNNLIEVASNVAPENIGSSDEFKLAVLRAKRDALLKADDGEKLKYYTQKIKDKDSQAWSDLQDYWQALRDLPATVNLTGKGIPDLINEFPVKPA